MLTEAEKANKGSRSSSLSQKCWHWAKKCFNSTAAGINLRFAALALISREPSQVAVIVTQSFFPND